MSAFTVGSPTTTRVATTNRGNRSATGAADDTDLSSTNRRGKPQRQNSIGGEFSRADGRHTSTRRATVGGASNNDTSRARVDNKDKEFSRRVVRNKSLSDVETLLSSSSTNMNIDGNIDGNSANSTFNNNRSATRTTRRESQQSSVRTNRRRSSRNLLGSSSMHGPISGDSIHCPDDGDCTRRISASSKDLLRMFNEE